MRLTVLLLCAGLLPAGAAGQAVTGVVTSGGRLVSGAQVSSEGGPTVLTGPDGSFRLRLEGGPRVLVIDALGYARSIREVRVPVDGVVSVRIELAPAAVALDAVVVTGTMRERSVGESPVKVERVSGRMLQRLATNNLMESIQHVNGLYAQVDCGVCYTNNIRINGMEGPYTAVLIDGMPILGGLASVYGLNGINPALVEQLEILKGPSSTLYGTEAMGGVVNVITKDPRFAPRWVMEASGSADNEVTADVAVAPTAGRLRSIVSGSLSRSAAFVDRNEDGFTDFPRHTRGTVFARADVVDGVDRVGGITARAYWEDRFGGVREWRESLRGSDEVYGESIVTRRFELLANTRLPGLPESFRLDVSGTWHDQDSWYGAVRYAARQRILFGNLTWSGEAGRHRLLAGVTGRHQTYDDETPATGTAERRLIPGVFLQDEWEATEALTLLGGVRFDHHDAHGVITSPRASLKWSPWHDTQIRVNGGTGFRVVNLFTEDHAALTGARQVVIRSKLRPERSWSVAANLNQVLDFDVNPMMVDVDAFYTRFTNRIVADYDVDPDLIVYDNLDGSAVTRGVALSLNQNFARFPLLYTVGVTFQDVTITRAGAREDEFFAPDWKAVWSLAYTFAGPSLTVDWTGTAVGSMRLPEYAAPYTRATRSPTYAVHNLKATVRLAGGLETWLALNNILDFRQGSPLVAPDRPFSDAFDTSYVWGPIRGRQVLVGARWSVSR